MIINKQKIKNKTEKLIFNEIGKNQDILAFIKKYFDLNDKQTHVTSTSSHFNINTLKKRKINNLINLKEINDSRYINKLFESVNIKLSKSALFFGCVITYPNRRNAILSKYPIFINWVIYFFDTLFTRVFPKLLLTRKLYFYFTKGRGRVISRAETLGRLYSCGFQVVDEATFNNRHYFIARKLKKPEYDKNPTYGMFISLKRVGKNNKLFNVYKLRTMHPFSEYLQEYIYKKNYLDDRGKMKNDFRISPEGRFFRKFWIDELPMILNLIKGDMKIVGVRPLSEQYFNLYDKELKKLRTRFKPGLVPPFYADLPSTFEEIMESEKKYLQLYEKSPFITDFKYFFLAFKNIIFRGARSN